ncbi:hypothetical protein [Kitasatospora sp. NBC_01300]|uniref:hypothetical protein n=1 Tax=Kitasatospora sp. NBC_01300 TaxID=2903574 RepID=UPI002F909124|nr:hypothetical protein OG556_33795 [Kitasatospora sp. NBC_01300]WSK09945.1 hypothetical protein OG556_39780 [Kitasatospora sp. NBC_01300]
MEIRLVDEHFMKARWDDIETTLRRTFRDSSFNDSGYTVDNPVDFTRSAVHGGLGPGIKHLVALDDSGHLMGGFFCIPTERGEGQEATDIGWFFSVPELDRDHRRAMVDAFVERMFQTLREAGFKRIETNMGTPAGAKALGQRYGFVHAPTAEHANRWLREL